MTKEELKQEAEEWLCNNLHSASEEDFIKAMVDIAEPREKQIQIDAEQIRALQKQNGELTDKVKELEAQIADLEKENAELKEKVNILDNCDRLGDVITEAYKDQLTKAKEIIKELMSFSVQLCDCRHTVDFEKTREEAEQFLSEEK